MSTTNGKPAPSSLPSKRVAIHRKWRGPVPTDRLGNPIAKRLWPQRRRCVWQVRWFEYQPGGGIRRRSTTLQTRREAEAFRAVKASELERKPETRTAARKITLGEFAAEFVEARIGSRGQRLRPTTLVLSEQCLRRLMTFVGRDLPLTHITSERLDAFINHLYGQPGLTGGKLSTQTIAKTIRTLKACFAVAVSRRGYIRVNPLAGYRIAKPRKPVVRYVTQQEFAALLGAARSDRKGRYLWWEAFLTLSYTTALRYGEVINLTWADVDFEAGTIRVAAKQEGAQTFSWEPKTVESLREVPAPASTMTSLQQLLEYAQTGNAYVFIPVNRVELIREAKKEGSWKETSQLLNNFQRGFKTLVKRAAESRPSLIDSAGKPTVSIHDFRRTCITHWTETLPMQATAKLAGHSNIQTTANYYASTTPSQREAAREASQLAVQAALKVLS